VRESLTALLAAMLTAIALFAFAGYQVTGEPAASKLLGRLAASLIELDRWVPMHREDVQLAARDRPQDAVLVDDLPVDVVLPSPAVLDADDAGLRDMLRAAMGRRLYREGRNALQDEAGESHLPVTEPVRWTVSLLGSGAHSFWRIATVVAGLSTLALMVSLVAGRRSPLPALLGGAVTAAVASFFLWLVAGAGNSVFESAVDREIMLILRDGAWLGLRNAAAMALIALSVIFLWRTLIEPRREHAEAYWPDFEGSDVYPSDSN
jgi:hypothetical protein